MDSRLQVHFHGMETSTALEARVRDRFEEIARRCPSLTLCRVTIEKETRNHRTGNQFRVGLLLHRRGRDIVAGKGTGKDQAHADVYAALRDSFDSAERQLEEFER
jgi:putative sigma-54 modulation protein